MEILELLEALKAKVEELNPVPQNYLISRGSYNGFEDLIPELLEELKMSSKFNFTYKNHYGHHFPDLDIILNNEKYGLELKSRNNGTFETNGNSVFESISNSDYKELYVFFGSHKKSDTNPRIKVKFLPYWQAASSIVVTHSPRFKISMSDSDSVFESAEQYNLLRDKSGEEKSTFLQNYLENHTTGAKWFVSRASNEISPLSLNSLDKNIQNKIVSEILVLFPQDIIKSNKEEKQRSNYSRSSQHVITEYFYFSSSFRDFFSSGGKWQFKGYELPKVFKKVKDNRHIINQILSTASKDFKRVALESWNELNLYINSNNDFSDSYYTVLDYLGNEYFYSTLKKVEINKLSDLLLLP